MANKKNNKFVVHIKNNQKVYLVVVVAVLFFGSLILIPTFNKNKDVSGDENSISKSKQSSSDSAGIKLKTEVSTVDQGGSFTVEVYADSKSEAVNAVGVELEYPTADLEMVSIDTSQSAYSIMAEEVAANGLIEITRGTMDPLTGEQFVATIVFKALSSNGNLTLNSSKSQLLSSSTNQNIATENDSLSIGPGR